MRKSILVLTLLCLIVQNIHSQNIDNIIKSKPFEFTGNVGGNLNMYQAYGIDRRLSPWQYGIHAKVNMKIYGISLPFYASYRDNSFAYGSPYLRLRINPSYKWAKLSIGDVYMNMSPYTMSNRTVRGMGLTLTPGKFMFKTLYGKIEDLRAYRDTLQAGIVPIPTYTRRLAGVAVGYGKNVFKTEIMVIKTWDDFDSLQVESPYTPKSNLVLGNKTNLRLGKKIFLETNLGASLFTSNLDSYGENYTIGNNALTNNIAEGNISTHLSFAGDAALRYQASGIGLNLRAQYIQPYYQPLSVAYLNNDLLNTTLGANVRLFKKVAVNGSLGVQTNNISGNQLSTARNLILNLTSSIPFSKNVSLSINYANYTQDYSAQQINIGDLYTYAVTNRNSSASLRIGVPINKERQLNFNINGGLARYNILTEEDASFNDYNSIFANVTSTFQIKPLKFNWSIGLNYRTMSREEADQTFYGITNAFTKRLYDDKISLNLRSSFKINNRNEKTAAQVLTNQFLVNYRISKTSLVGLNISHLYRDASIFPNFSELRSGLRFNHSLK